MKTLIYRMGQGPWRVHTQGLRAAKLNSVLDYDPPGTAVGYTPLQPAHTEDSITYWDYPGPPPFQATTLYGTGLQVVLNARSTGTALELLKLKLEYRIDPLNGTPTGTMRLNVLQGGIAIDPVEVLVGPGGAPHPAPRQAPLDLEVGPWRDLFLFFDWRP